MNILVLPADAQSLVNYLYSSSMSSSRTLDTLYHVCPREMHIQETLRWLIENDYVYQDGAAYDLTALGMRAAQEAQHRTQIAGPVSAQNGQSDIPTADLHPLRTHTSPLQQQAAEVNYLLAFENPTDALPIPILDGDTIGRQTDTTINLTHDNFISGHHCRFSVQMEDNRLHLSIEDLGSRNGTFVDGQRLEPGQITELEHGSRIEMGHTLLIVVKIPY
ncbi:MAG TPA: FHA domain-containing protein [Phototrophicaceae bacterium]|nr:FHA domain-containing protein [Phototrophicaceae bacterium]